MRVAVIFLALFTLINCLCDQNCENCEVNNGNNDAEDTEICTKCKKGYNLDKSNACIEANTALPGCEVFDSENANKCKFCLDGYELKIDGTCNQIYEYKECGGVRNIICGMLKTRRRSIKSTPNGHREIRIWVNWLRL